MKKNLTTLALALCGLATQAQNTVGKYTNEIATEGADIMCTCINKTVAHIDQDVQKVLMDVTTMKDQEAMTEYMKTLEPELLQRSMEQLPSVSKLSNSKDFQNCLNSWALGMEKYEGNEEALKEFQTLDKEQMLKLMVSKLKDEEGCEFGYFLLDLGMKQQQAKK